MIENVLGHGGFGITYLAGDSRLGAKVAIKEYFPQAYAHRDHTQTIHPNRAGDSGDAENYRWGLQEFLKEARALAQFKHANIVRVLRFLEANGTAYMVMEYEEGESLSGFLAHQGGFLSEQALLSVFLPVLNGLQAVHDAGLLHLDIKPDNIYLRRSGPPMLIDFGAARQRQGENRSEKIALTPGYAALEQYPGHGELGPWSDVYSMGATLYRCITGQRARRCTRARARPEEAASRPADPGHPLRAPSLQRPHPQPASMPPPRCLADNRPKSAFALQNGLMGKGMNEARKAADGNAFSRGQGFLGVVATRPEGRKKRFIPRGPLERLLVFAVFTAVMIVAPVRIMVAFNYLSEDEVYDYIDRLQVAVVDTGKRGTRFIEENVFGITRPPEYIPPPPAMHAIARPAPVVEERAAAAI
ncbi:MAG: serine/threonine protein kinase [Desulfosudis oleivorans]|nr:serine/threonine protein kinase [Desulfosudis oleivorans]